MGGPGFRTCPQRAGVYFRRLYCVCVQGGCPDRLLSYAGQGGDPAERHPPRPRHPGAHADTGRRGRARVAGGNQSINQ